MLGNVAVHGLWKHRKTCDFDIVITDTDTKAYKHLSLRTVVV